MSRTGEQFNNRFSKTIIFQRIFVIVNDEVFLNERIEVAATFGGGLNPCYPHKFKRANGRIVEVSEIGLRHPTTKGRRTIHVFDVTDGAADYRLEFDSERLTWRLTREGDRA